MPNHRVERTGIKRMPPGIDFSWEEQTGRSPSPFGPWNRQVRCEEEVKTTRYFEHMRKRPDRRIIRDEWISYVIETPEKTEVQADGRIRKWAWISEEGKFLRVVLLEDGETVHNVFFDRSFKESRK